MKKSHLISTGVGLLFILASIAEGKQENHAANPFKPLPKDLEIKLALSSLPAHLRGLG